MGGARTRHRHAPRRHRHIQDPAAGHPPRSDERSRAGRTRSFVAAETFPGPAQAPHSTMLFIYIIPLVLLRPVGAMDPPGFLDGESGTGEVGAMDPPGFLDGESGTGEVYGDSGAMGDAYYGDSGAGDSGATDGPGFFAGAVDPALFLCSSTSEYLNEANECETCPLNAACDGMEATCDDKDQYVKDGACTSCPATFRCDGKVAKCDLDKFLDEAEQCADCPYGWVCNGVTKETCGDTMYINENRCESCPEGYTCDGTAATKCDDSKYVDDNECLECPTGYTCDGATKTCAADKYVDDNECLECPTGHTCDGADATKCAADKYVDDNKCLPCPDGYHEYPAEPAYYVQGERFGGEPTYLPEYVCDGATAKYQPKFAFPWERVACMYDNTGEDPCGSCCPECLNGRTLCACVVLTTGGQGFDLTDHDDCVFIRSDDNIVNVAHRVRNLRVSSHRRGA